MEQLHQEEDQLVGDVCNHLVDIQPLVTMLETLTGQIRELEKYSQYLHCLAQIEDLRFLLHFNIYFLDIFLQCTASAVLATAIPSGCLSICPSVCHRPVLCQNDGTQYGAVCTVG